MFPNHHTDDDRDHIKQLVEEYRREHGISQQSSDPTFTDDFHAPEVYIARPVSGTGIDGISGDTPGTGDCDIYEVIGSTRGLNAFEYAALEAYGASRL